MLEELKQRVWKANLDLVKEGLVMLTWGNVSGIDRKSGYVVIKPSGVAYDLMKPDDMVVMNLEGKIVEGDYKPSVDLASHLELYKGFSDIEGVVHTHSHYATCFAQACRNIECMGTTHADFCWKDVPVTDILTDDEVREDYEKNIGLSIVRKVKESGRTEKECPAGLAANHGPFAWGETVEKAVENAVVLEEVAKMALNTLVLSEKNVMSQFLMEKHFRRKHGEKAYYGQ